MVVDILSKLEAITVKDEFRFMELFEGVFDQ